MCVESETKMPTRRSLHRLLRVGLPILLCCIGIYHAFFYFLPVLPAAPFIKTQPSGRLLDAQGRLLTLYLNEDDQWCLPCPETEISPLLKQATIAVEDQRFYQHRGIDTLAFLRAMFQNMKAGHIVSGASTLTMQLAKLSGHPSHSWHGKLNQLWLALCLEKTLDKTAILNSYLNKAPYGNNLLGVEAAALRYFGKPNTALSLAEAALLAGLPKAPSALNPLRHPEAALLRRNHVLIRMRQEGFIDEKIFKNAVQRPITVAWHPFPHLAPHVAQRFQSDVRKKGCVQLTLHSSLQKRMENLLTNYLKQYNGEITNGAIMVIDCTTAEIRAQVGSANFFNLPGGGQVDLSRALRSPGSTLKPFVYALAMEKNCLYASEVLLDDTLDLGAYNPGNFDGEYNGLITAGEALHYSLNIPAILVLERTGVAPLLTTLQRLGLSTLTESPSFYGLGLTLGNCETRLDELCAAYLALASLGSYRPLRIQKNTLAPTPVQIFSRGVALALYNMLEAPFPTDDQSGLTRPRRQEPRVCWKTGTSTGLHDAWTFAFNKQYVVGVWLGNNTGRPSSCLVGARAALPLAAQIFRRLPKRDTPPWPAPGDELHNVTVCALSGLPVGKWCPHKKTVALPKNQFLHRRCQVHTSQEPSGEIATYWPGTALHWDLASIESAPPQNVHTDENKSLAIQKCVLQITQPVENAVYVLTGEKGGDCIEAQSSVAQEPLFWYQNGRYIGESDGEHPLYIALKKGEHTLACMRATGEKDMVQFSVTLPQSNAVFQTE